MNEFLNYNSGGFLEYNGINLVSLKEKTPLFIFSQDKILKQYSWLKQKSSSGFGKDVGIIYDVKANETKAIIKLLYSQGCFFSINQIEQLRKLVETIEEDHIEKIILYNNPLIEKEELMEVLSYGVKKFVVSSKENFRVIRGGVEEQEIGVYLRVKTEVDVENDHSKKEEIGFHLKDVGDFLLEEIENLKIRGLYNKLITQNTELRSVEENIKEISELLLRLKFKNIKIPEVIINLGLPIGAEKEESGEIIGVVSSYLKEVEKDFSFEVSLESGRYIVGEAGVLLTKIKSIQEERIVLDVSKYNFFNLEDFPYSIRTVKEGEGINWYTLTGKTLLPRDEFSEVELPHTKVGDLLVFENAGAYSLNSDFLSMEKPRIVMIKK